jgi:hypothetical protein
MILHKLRKVVAAAILLLSLGLLVWAILPNKREVVMLVLPPIEMWQSSSGREIAPAILETRRVRLEYPESLRIGDQGVILLNLETVKEDPSSPIIQNGLSNAYNSYNVMAEAKFEVAGVRVEPANPTRVSMPPGQPVRFKWQISAEQAGAYGGNVWLSLRFLPLDGSTPIQEPIYVKEVWIKTTSLLGFSGTTARLVGGVGVLLSLLLVFNDMIDWWKKK